MELQSHEERQRHLARTGVQQWHQTEADSQRQQRHDADRRRQTVNRQQETDDSDSSILEA